MWSYLAICLWAITVQFVAEHWTLPQKMYSKWGFTHLYCRFYPLKKYCINFKKWHDFKVLFFLCNFESMQAHHAWLPKQALRFVHTVQQLRYSADISITSLPQVTAASAAFTAFQVKINLTFKRHSCSVTSHECALQQRNTIAV